MSGGGQHPHRTLPPSRSGAPGLDWCRRPFPTSTSPQAGARTPNIRSKTTGPQWPNCAESGILAQTPDWQPRRKTTQNPVAASHTSGKIGNVASDYAKVSVSLPAPLVERIKNKVGSRGLSRYVAEALEREERRQALRDWLGDQDRANGPVPDDVMQEVRRQWLGADSVAG